MLCGNNKCILLANRCDGILDCGDELNSDELNCTFCQPGSVFCDNKCLAPTFRCDGERNCSDGTDETDCNERHINTCNSEEFSCGDTQCIDKESVCDGINDCFNSKDETDCKDENSTQGTCEILEKMLPCQSITQNSSCTEGRRMPWRQKSTFLALNQSKDSQILCDRKTDCPYGKDESAYICGNLKLLNAKNISEIAHMTLSGNPACYDARKQPCISSRLEILNNSRHFFKNVKSII
jgi:hypothetical protein